MPAQHLDLPQGTLDLLILRTLGPQHGWISSERVQQLSIEVLRIQQDSLYSSGAPACASWVDQGSLGTSENNRCAKYYELSKKGREQFEMETNAWKN
jgi:hypothetical protein